MLCVVRIFKALRGKCMSCDWDCGDKSDLTCEEDMCRGFFSPFCRRHQALILSSTHRVDEAVAFQFSLRDSKIHD